VHKILTFAAYGFLTFGGTMHFAIDVVSQYLRGKRVPGPETTLYFGLNTAYAIGQVAFGILGLLVAWQSLELIGRWPMVLLSLGVAACWLGFSFVFLEYPEPRVIVGIFGALVVAAALTK